MASAPPVLREDRDERTRTFVVLMTAASALGLLKGVVYGKVLGAHELGYWGLVLIVSQFGVNFSSWGIMSALNYQLPIAFGRAESDVQDMVDRSLGAVLLTSGVSGVLYLGVVTLLRPQDPNAWAALSLAAVVTGVTVIFEFSLLLLRVERRLLPLGGLYLGRSVIAVVLGAAAGAEYGYLGVIGAEVSSLSIAILVGDRRWLHLRPRRPRRSAVVSLMRWGAPLTVANTVVVATFTADRIFVAAALPSSLGQYTFASLVVVGWAAVLGILSQTTAPRLLFDYGAGLGIRGVRMKAVRATGFLFAAGAAGLAILLLARGWLESGPFSEFRPALEVMPILYGGGLMSIVGFPGFILGALRPSLALLAAAVGTVTAVAGGALLVAAGAGLASFAWLFTVSQAVTVTVKLGGLEWIVRHPDRARGGHLDMGAVPLE